MGYYVFVDNSNVWIEGKFAAAVEKGWVQNTSEAHLKGIQDNAWRIDYGKLLDCVTEGNVSEIKKAVLFGSKPPHNDQLWKALAKASFTVNALDRNIAGKEKAVDTGIVSVIDKTLYREASEGDIFILVMGDKDFKPVLDNIREEKCKSVVAFWDNASGELISEADEYINLTSKITEITH